MTCSTPYNLTAFFNPDLNLVHCHKRDNLVMFGLRLVYWFPDHVSSLLWLWPTFLDHLLAFLPPRLNCIFLSCKRLFSLWSSGASFSLHFSPGFPICSWLFLPPSDHERLSHPWNMKSNTWNLHRVGSLTECFVWNSIIQASWDYNPDLLVILHTTLKKYIHKRRNPQLNVN